MTEIADIVLTPDYHIGTVTGRIQCQTPNIMEIPREHCWDSWRECSDKFWSNKHTEADTKDCNDCQYRFKCWTERKVLTEDDTRLARGVFAQMHLRQLEIYKTMVGVEDGELVVVLAEKEAGRGNKSA